MNNIIAKKLNDTAPKSRVEQINPSWHQSVLVGLIIHITPAWIEDPGTVTLRARIIMISYYTMKALDDV